MVDTLSWHSSAEVHKAYLRCASKIETGECECPGKQNLKNPKNNFHHVVHSIVVLDPSRGWQCVFSAVLIAILSSPRESPPV